MTHDHAAARDTPRPWPGSADAVAAWVLEGLHDGVGRDVEVTGLERATVDVELDGPDLASLLVDLSGIELRLHAGAGATTPTATATDTSDVTPPTPIDVSNGVARRIECSARPLRLLGEPVTLDVRATDVPIEWRRFAEPVEPARPSSDRDLTVDERDVPPEGAPDAPCATVEASIDRDALVRIVERAATVLLDEAGAGVRLRRFALAIDGADQRRFSIDVQATVAWKVVSASARATIGLGIDPDGTVHVHSLRLTSRNPLIAIALRLPAVRRRIDDLGLPRTFASLDIVQLTAHRALALRDTRLTLGQHLTLVATLA